LGYLEKLAEENQPPSAFIPGRMAAGLVFQLLKTDPLCNAICIEYGQSASERSIQLVSSITGSRKVETKDFQLKPVTTSRTSLHIVVPKTKNTQNEGRWPLIEAICAAVL